MDVDLCNIMKLVCTRSEPGPVNAWHNLTSHGALIVSAIYLTDNQISAYDLR